MSSRSFNVSDVQGKLGVRISDGAPAPCIFNSDLYQLSTITLLSGTLLFPYSEKDSPTGTTLLRRKVHSTKMCQLYMDDL